MTAERDDPIAGQTTTGLGRAVGALAPRAHAPLQLPALTLLCHPRLERTGERAVLAELGAGRPAQLSRQEPTFAPPPGAIGAPLDDPHVSRRPVRLIPAEGGGVRVVAADSRTAVTIDGAPVAERLVGPAELAAGVVITLAHRIALLLHTVPVAPVASPARSAGGMVGHSAAILDVQDELRRVAPLDIPVLVRGETGTGKELVARAIHQLGPRRAQPLVAVNLGALPPALAAAELFGAVKGAYTGAVRDHDGYFRRAHRGTLFLDEIGEAPPDVQVMLLRALETGEIAPLGGQRAERVDVRIIAATDADLERKARDGAFRLPLLHRLAGYEIRIPPLRERRDDVARLLVHFLRQEREALGEPWPPVADARAAPWLAPELVARLVRHDWPGNIRQLRNVARQIAIASQGRPEVALTPALERVLGGPVPSSAPGLPAPADPAAPSHSPPPRVASHGSSAPGLPAPADPAAPSPPRRPADVPEDEMLAALEASRWDLAATARALHISRPSLYLLIERSGRVRTAGDLGADEIARCHRELDGDLDEMAMRLRVSRSALRRRLHELGLR